MWTIVPATTAAVAYQGRSGTQRPSVLPGALGTQTWGLPLIIRRW
jgi:hypothetical protein